MKQTHSWSAAGSIGGLGLLLALSACGNYRVNRSALAPRPQPVMHSGQPMSGTVELSAGVSSASHIAGPWEGNPESGVEVPGTQIHGDARFRLGETFSLGLLYEQGLDAGSKQPNPDQAPVDGKDVLGFGIGGETSIATSVPGLRFGISIDLMSWRVPWVEWRTCVDDCLPGGDGFTYESNGVDSATTIGLGVAPSYRQGNLTYFAGINARNHPTIQRKGMEDAGDLFEGGDVESGPLNLTASAGIEIDFGSVRGLLLVHQTLTRDPVSYGPSIGALLTVPIGGGDKATPTTAAPAAPPPGGAPGIGGAAAM